MSDMNAAWATVERLRVEGWHVEVCTTSYGLLLSEDGWAVRLWGVPNRLEDEPWFEANAPTAVEAIRRVARSVTRSGRSANTASRRPSPEQEDEG